MLCGSIIKSPFDSNWVACFKMPLKDDDKHNDVNNHDDVGV